MKTQVTVLIADSHRKKFSQVQSSLQAAGLTNIQAQKAVGTITGEVREEELENLRAVSGVEAVEASASYQLPPPDSEVQ